MLVTAVCADALVPNCQQWVLRVRQSSAEEVMIRVNVLGALGTAVIAVLTGQASAIPRFLAANPQSLVYLTGIGVFLGCGVFCYTVVIERAGSVAAVAVSTCRKVATLIFSFAVFPKPFGSEQQLGLVFLCGAVALQYSAVRRKAN